MRMLIKVLSIFNSFFVIDGFLEVSVKRNLPGTIDAVSGSGRSRDEEILFEVKASHSRYTIR